MTERAELVSQIVQRHREALIEAGASSNTNNLRLAVHAVGVDIARALQDERDGGWQDIETVPENVSVQIHIPHLDYYGNNGVYAGMLVNMGTGKRWMTFGHAIGRDLGLEDHPTAWRPLPRPPHSKDSEG